MTTSWCVTRRGQLMKKLMLLLFINTCKGTTKKTIQESYIALEEHIRNSNPIKHKLPVNIAGSGMLELFWEVFQVVNVNEVNQAVTVASFFGVVWNYPELRWNKSDYHGLDKITLYTSEVWTPSIISPKSTSTSLLSMPSTVDILETGTVTALILGNLETICYLDLLEYPFDQHNCSVPFFGAKGLSVVPTLEHSLPENLTGYLGTSGEWILTSHGCNAVHVRVAEANFTECWFIMKRRITFHVAAVICPIVSVSVVTLLVFCFPAESGEKVSYIVSMFVSMSMYISLIADIFPRSMNKLPRIVMLISAIVVIIVLSAAATAVVMQRYNREQAEEKRRLGKYGRRHFDNCEISVSSESSLSTISSNQKRVTSLRCIEDNLRSSQDTTETWAHRGPLEADHSNCCHYALESGPRRYNKVGAINDIKTSSQCKTTPNQKSVSRLNFRKLSHGQLDMIFFWFFLCVNMIVYLGIMFI